MPDDDHEILRARKTALVYVRGKRRRIQRGVTTAHAGHKLVRDKPQLWEPITPDYAVSDGADKSEAEHATPPAKPLEDFTVDELETMLTDDRGRDLGQVREWAEAQGITLSESGYVPKSVLVDYLRA